MSVELKNYDYKPIENEDDSLPENREVTIKNESNVYKKLFLFTAVICLIILLTLYYNSFYYDLIEYQVLIIPNTTTKTINFEEHSTKMNESNLPKKTVKKGVKYLVFSPKCKILDLDPFSKEAMKYVRLMKYINCSKHQLLTYVTKKNNVATVHVDKNILSSYTKKAISCCYSNIIRHSPPNRPDDHIKVSGCQKFKDEVNITKEAIFIKCTEICTNNCTKNEKTIYENVHTAITIDKNVQEKMNKWKTHTEKPISVLMIGIDSVSRLNIFRKMKKTTEYIKKNHWLTLEGYNKMASNTFPNLLGALGGIGSSIQDSHPEEVSPFLCILTLQNLTLPLPDYEPVFSTFLKELFDLAKHKISSNLIPTHSTFSQQIQYIPNQTLYPGLSSELSYKLCKPASVGGMDKCPLIWYTYRNLGYVTAYAEDDPYISTFNYLKKGFRNPPSDYYFRPYVLATDKLLKSHWLDGTKYCTGPETAGERIMYLAKDFAMTFKNTPSFGLFWMNSFSHNALNTPQVMDEKVQTFLLDLEKNGVYNNTLVIFFSDHGMRFGGIRSTETGWLEVMLPFIFLSFPPWFKKSFPKEYQNFLNNKNQLTTPYDLYMTLQHLLVLSKLNYTVTSGKGCPKCVSLFKETLGERSCEDVSIPESYCACKGYVKTSLSRNITKKVSKFLKNQLTKMILKFREGNLCAKYEIQKLSNTKLSQDFPLDGSSNHTYAYLRVDFETKPKAKFGTKLMVIGNINLGNYTIGSLSRLDKYGSHSKCVKDEQLKVYCYCL